MKFKEVLTFIYSWKKNSIKIHRYWRILKSSTNRFRKKLTRALTDTGPLLCNFNIFFRPERIYTSYFFNLQRKCSNAYVWESNLKLESLFLAVIYVLGRQTTVDDVTQLWRRTTPRMTSFEITWKSRPGGKSHKKGVPPRDTKNVKITHMVGESVQTHQNCPCWGKFSYFLIHILCILAISKTSITIAFLANLKKT